MRLQDGMHLVLDPRPVPDDLVASRNKPPPTLGLGVGQPNLGQEVGRPQLRQHAGVDLVGFDPGVRDRLHLQRVGHDHARHVGAEHAHHRHGVAGRLDDNLIRPCQRPPEAFQPRPGHVHSSEWTQSSILPGHHLREGAVDVHADHTSHPAPPST